MRSIKVFVIIVVIMMVFFGIITVFLPSKITVSKSILINATEAEIATEIGGFKNWKRWYPAFQNQEVVVTTSQNNDSSFVTLTDEEQRKLSMRMVKPGPENITVLLLRPNKNDVMYQFIFSPRKAGETLLTWNVNTTLPWYPWEKITGIFLDKVYGPQYMEILQGLKTAVEKTHQEGLSK